MDLEDHVSLIDLSKQLPFELGKWRTYFFLTRLKIGDEFYVVTVMSLRWAICTDTACATTLPCLLENWKQYLNRAYRALWGGNTSPLLCTF